MADDPGEEGTRRGRTPVDNDENRSNQMPRQRQRSRKATGRGSNKGRPLAVGILYRVPQRAPQSLIWLHFATRGAPQLSLFKTSFDSLTHVGLL